MSSPLVPQGTLNRLRGSISFIDFPELNITAPFLGEEGINLAPEGEITNFIPTMTGVVQSQAPYQMITVEVELIKSQAFSDQFKQKLEDDASLGRFIVRPDAPTLSPYTVENGAIGNASPGRLNGKSVGFVLTLRGFYQVNSGLYNGI